MKINGLLIAVASSIVLGCAPPGSRDGEPEAAAAVAAVLPPTARSAPLEHGAPVNPAFWQGPGGETYVLVAAGIEGLEVLRNDGRRAGLVAGIEAGFVATVPDVARADSAVPLVLVYDPVGSRVAAYRLDADGFALRPAMPEPIPARDEVTGLCHYVSRLSGSVYVYVVTDGGLIHQYELYANGDDVAARSLRTIPSGKGSGFCAADARDGWLYVAEESTGIWRLGAEPESDTTREPVDLREPFGGLSDDLKGVDVVAVDADRSYLVVADVAYGQLAVYGLPDATRLATIKLEGLHEPEGLAVSSIAAGDEDPAAMLAIADESADDGGPNVKLVAWDAVAEAAGLPGAGAASDTDRPRVVRAVAETDVMPSYGDAADDPAIWVDATDPSRSLVIGTNKQGSLHVFDLDGRTLQVLPDGKMNNVDLRDGFPLGAATVPLVTASNRSNDGIAAYRIDGAARKLVEVAAGILPTGFTDPYGLCMYRSAKSGEFYVFVNEGGIGTFRQWRLFDDGSGRVAAERVREFEVGSQAEGCVADDESGRLYVAEEDAGLWRYSAEPDGGDDRVLIDSTGDGGRLTDDVEGVALWIGVEGGGYLVASNQGADNYAVYRRDGGNDYLGHFHIVANPALGIDGASETDGLDVTSAALGPDYPDGLLVVQDGRNIAPEEPQNFKLVSWRDVARALALD